MLIGFVTAGLSFSGDSIQRSALGGSETALLCMAEALVRRGHKVMVFCTCDKPGAYNGVEYYSRDQFPAQAAVTPFDVLISSRWAQFLSIASSAALRVLWMHDILTADKKQFVPLLWQTDLLMPLSDYHVEDICKKAPELRKNIWKTSNAVDVDLIKQAKQPKVPNKLIYTSRPERGLLLLLHTILPKLLEKKPALKLHYCCYGMSGNMEIPEQVKRLHAQCEALAKKFPNSVRNMGSLPKKGLYQQISSSQLLLYPTAFPEISCITAMEAQACGTPIVTTDDFALSETVGTGGVKIPGSPDSAEYVEKFVATTLRLLDDQDEHQRLRDAGPLWVEDRGYTWDKVAASWERKFSDMLQTRYRDNREGVIKELLRNNDIQVATLLAKKENLPEMVLAAEKMASEIPSRPMYDADELPRLFQKSMPRFDRVLQLFNMYGGIPKTLLDYDCTEVAMGLVAAKACSGMKVTLVPKTREIGEILGRFAAQSKLDVEIREKPEEGVKYDAVFVDEQLDAVSNPQTFLEMLQQKFLTDKGAIGFTVRIGTRRSRLSAQPDRLWNFDSSDLQNLLGHTKYGLAFNDGRKDAAALQVVGHWCGVFMRAKKFGKVNIQEKALRTRPYQTLAVCMITKNEEEWLLGSLKSLAPIADKLVVVDSGSTDRTVEYAKEFGAEIRTIDFDNFSHARNASLEGLKEDWVFWMDADERLVGSENIPPYLQSAIFEGYAIKQNHLMMDVDKSFDLPIRLFRRRDQYKFVGLVHEHCEDTSRGSYDNEIRPTLVLDTVDIAHYGYLNEAGRRQKCSFRNMDLLRRDIEENGNNGRMLTWVLVLRDYINIVKWRIGRTGGSVAEGSVEHRLLNAAVTTYLHYFAAGKTKYTDLAHSAYQDALLILGRNKLCYADHTVPPFQTDFGLAGAVCGMTTNNSVKPDRRWFLDDEEFVHFITDRGVELVSQLGVCEKEKYASALDWTPTVSAELPNATELLAFGSHAEI